MPKHRPAFEAGVIVGAGLLIVGLFELAVFAFRRLFARAGRGEAP